MTHKVFAALAVAPALAAGLGLGAACGGSSSSASPAIQITSPTANQRVARNQDGTISVGFAVQNFRLVAPGQNLCGTDTTTCGHVHVNLDGNTCNASTSPYNNTAVQSPGTALPSLCPGTDSFASGSTHTLELTLHNDAHQDPGGVRITSGTVSFQIQ